MVIGQINHAEECQKEISKQLFLKTFRNLKLNGISDMVTEVHQSTKDDPKLIFTYEHMYLLWLFQQITFLLSGGIKLELLDNNEKPLLDLTPDFVLTSDDDKYVST